LPSAGGRAQAAPATVTGRAHLQELAPSTFHWMDVDNGTTFSLTYSPSKSQTSQCDARHPPYFTFGLPNGDQLRGCTTNLQPDTSTSPTTLVASQCERGVLASQAGATDVVFFLQARTDEEGLLAYARMAYLPVDTGSAEQVCKAAGGRSFAEMRSGCDTTS